MSAILRNNLVLHHVSYPSIFTLFFFNDTATTEIYTLSLHDALPICRQCSPPSGWTTGTTRIAPRRPHRSSRGRSEEHTSELQSQSNLVCRLLLEKKKLGLLLAESRVVATSRVGASDAMQSHCVRLQV